MSVTHASEESCTTQRLSPETPSSEWDLDRLGEHARELHEQIANKEHNLARDYWLLGQVIVVARRQFQYGQWVKFLTERGIDKTRASRAMAIYRTFSQVADLDTLTVKQAYAARKVQGKRTSRQSKNRSRKPIAQSEFTAPTSLGDWLDVMTTKSTRFTEEATFATGDAAGKLLDTVDQAMQQLQGLRELLAQRMAI